MNYRKALARASRDCDNFGSGQPAVPYTVLNKKEQVKHVVCTYLWGGMQGTDTTGAAALLSAKIFLALFILSLDFAFARLARSELQPLESSSWPMLGSSSSSSSPSL